MLIKTSVEVVALTTETELWVEIGELSVFIMRAPTGLRISVHPVGEETTHLCEFIVRTPLF